MKDHLFESDAILEANYLLMFSEMAATRVFSISSKQHRRTHCLSFERFSFETSFFSFVLELSKSSVEVIRP
jgi:hypothetical protein